MLPIDIL